MAATPSIPEIVTALRAGEMTAQRGEELIYLHVDSAVDAASDRDGMAMSVLQGMLAGRVDTNMGSLIDRAYVAADAMCERRKRSGT